MHRNDRGSVEIVAIVILVIVFLIVAFYFLFMRQNEPAETTGVPQLTVTPEAMQDDTLVPCLSTATSQVESVIGYDEIKLTSVQRAADGSNETELSELPAISLSEFEASDWPEYDVVYSVTKDTKLYTGFWGVTTDIEVCDENNMTNAPLDDSTEVEVIPADAPAASAASYIQGGHIPAGPGTYRVDGYLFYDGVWHLTHQLQNVVFIK